MMEVFDLTVNEAYIRNGDPNLTFHYFATRNDAIANTGELIPATAALVGANVWIRVENNRVDYQGENCYVLVEQPLTVNPLPIIVQPLTPYRACDDNADGISVFDLTNPDLAEAILGATQLPADFTISYHPTQAAATAGSPTLPNSYTNVTPNAQDIYIRVVNNATSCVNTGVLPLAVEAYARAVGPQEFNECDNDGSPYDGVGLVDLTSYAPDILDGQDATIFLVSYYTSLADAVAGTNALTLAQAQAYQTDADTDTIWVKVENSSNLITPVCYAITTIDIKVERYPNPVINTANNVTTICVDFITDQVVRPLTLNSGVVNPNNYTYEWFEGTSTTPIPGATGPTYTVDTPAVAGATREYTVRVTSASPQACQTTSAAFSVVQSGQAVIAAGTVGYTVTGAFSSSQIITVTVEGYGAPDYQYSLDDGPRQDSNVFEGVSMGTHIIHVWDAKGDIAYSCEELIINEVYIIDYPHYFTPNGDGIHDTWNVVGLDETAKIFIFDRYGKLLKQISPTGNGWNGTYNGHLLPSDDYWFTVDFVEGGVMKQFKSHFAMKR
jgi:gliding motility-associated-like protein